MRRAAGIIPRAPAWHRHALPDPELQVVSGIGVSTVDTWAGERSIRGGNKLTATIGAQPVLLQLDPAQPPDPASWGLAPIYLPVGTWSHAGPFGRFRFRSAIPGRPGVVTFTAYAEPRPAASSPAPA